MSAAGTPGGAEDGAREVADLARQLRAELSTITEQGVRRQEAVMAFDEQLRVMESSIHAEVDRLRTTGNAVDLLTDQLRHFLIELRAERSELDDALTEVRTGLERVAADNEAHLVPVRTQLTELREQVSRLPAPDDTPIRQGLDVLAARLGALTPPDLTQLEERLEQLHARVAGIGTRDLRPLQDQLDALHQRVSALPQADTSAAMADALAGLAEQVDGLQAPDLAPLLTGLDALRADVEGLHDRLGALPAPDDTDLRHGLDALASQVDAVGGLIAGLPAPDDTALHDRLGTLAAQVDSLREQVAGLPAPDHTDLHADLAALDAQLTALRELVAAIPVADHSRLHADIDAIARRVDELPPRALLVTMADSLATIGDAVDALAIPDHVPLHEALDGLGLQLGALAATVEAQPNPDDTAVRASIDSVARHVAELRDRMAALPPAADHTLLHDHLDDVVGRVDAVAAGVGSLPQAEVIAALAASLDDLVARIDALPRPDDSAVQALIANVMAQVDAVHQRMGGLPQMEFAEAVSDGLLQVMARLESMRPSDLGPIEATALANAARLDALHRELAALPDTIPPPDDTEVRRSLEAVHAQLDGLRTSLADRFDAIPAPDLSTVQERLDALGADVAGLPRHDLAPVRLSLGTVADHLATMRATVDQLPTAASFEQLHTAGETARADLALVTEVLGALTELVQANDARLTDQLAAIIDTHSLGLAQVTASTDGVTTALGGLRAALAEQVGPLGGRLDELLDRLDELSRGVHTRVEQLGDQVVVGLTGNVAEVRSQLEALAAHVTATRDVALSEAVERLAERVDGIPTPDLGPVAAQLARLSAAISEQARAAPASVSHLEELYEALADPMTRVAEEQLRQADAATEATAAHRADLGRAAELIGERLGTVDASIGRLSVQLAEVASAPRRRRRGEEPVGATPVAGPALDLVAQVERDLQAVNGRLAVLADRVERAAIAAEDAADIAAAALRTAATPPAAPPVRSAPPKTTPAKKPAAKKTTAGPTAAKKAATKKTAAKKAPVKKAAPVKKPAARKAAATNAAPPPEDL